MKRTLVFGFGLGLLHMSLADNWPHWRGPTNNGVSVEKGLPLNGVKRGMLCGS